ncbi:bifunctional 5,10-methylene-tetrahydrofolate dehydrogenase/ 5,10-methylene-tetrahydrofolate cyclohydrolase [Alkalihalobacillus alcalophilus ATCC 27647 = CGMCC 1.3604]|uniref:Bifunctional protein FolD n=1 Tax=Alkalihalobacillus alcalophilus ATCC 27647 = CGMCC 1.3604 TaxID=1218173 RepID=A0A094WJE2_ALKAL|nr:bifunctional methylenetetrahydrofolate dehydrogenase/methenyltetrahydrofolate cyclohydrolase FolD [Alkalihalobacillus alcalophilus]KGA97899.1 5,10-methylene-tetrahydrofolate cyclohydrolase [Alkalihalobacillus alcalophilus ATCC 27647 = CGMCC 1.3604]MED1561483.1 bifunctional methylenetetrahydrofolate dehydrogenase/methenyltetrahydrofolate cyclohydrolase FolD [Alkalihalobacillus alcalophilus]THG88421.1 bifunctional 5,10-methylene-tetrahydrofolate dehydrogenase/ 5,10-methylene-tetrahydrofolate cy
MTATILDGKKIAKNKKMAIKEKVEALANKGIVPGLAVILVGEDPASQTYVRSKQKACKEVGIYSELIELPESASEQTLLVEIDRLNNDNDIDGILVQLPLPKQIREREVIERISPQKDVDGFHPINIGKMMIGEETFLPCTPFGILEMLKETKINLEGKHVVVIGRSNIVGKPVGQLLLNKNATVTYCHSKTRNLRELTTKADVLIVAVGRDRIIKADDVKQDAIVIDVGINRVDGKLYGDVDFENVKNVVSYITPVPGGVGPMTITMLLENTIQSAMRRGLLSC